MHIDRYELDGAVACSVAPDFGCNLFSWRVDGREMLYCPEGVLGNPTEFYHGGNPILFPAVGRTWDRSGSEPRFAVYNIYGRDEEYEMPAHGILPFCSWRKASEARRDDSIRVTYDCLIPPRVRLKYYPFEVDFRQTFTIGRRGLELEAEFVNRGEVPAPLAFGYHPYFALAADGPRQVELDIPCRHRLSLVPGLSIPSGEKEPAGMPVRLEDGQACDMVFSGLTERRAGLLDRRAGRAVRLEFDRYIEALVVYAGAEAPFVCLEPWTGGLGAYESLCRRGWETAGDMPVLAPGEIRKITVSYRPEVL